MNVWLSIAPVLNWSVWVQMGVLCSPCIMKSCKCKNQKFWELPSTPQKSNKKIIKNQSSLINFDLWAESYSYYSKGQDNRFFFFLFFYSFNAELRYFKWSTKIWMPVTVDSDIHIAHNFLLLKLGSCHVFIYIYLLNRKYIILNRIRGNNTRNC